MNVTEAVDSLSAMFPPPSAQTHTASLTFFFFFFFLRSPSYHVGRVLISAEITPKKFQSGGEKKKKICTSVIFLIKLISLKIPRNRSQLNVCCDLFSFSSFLFFFHFSHGYRIFLATPYFHHHLTEHVATCPRSTLATHGRHIHGHFRICWFWQRCH